MHRKIHHHSFAQAHNINTHWDQALAISADVKLWCYSVGVLLMPLVHPSVKHAGCTQLIKFVFSPFFVSNSSTTSDYWVIRNIRSSMETTCRCQARNQVDVGQIEQKGKDGVWILPAPLQHFTEKMIFVVLQGRACADMHHCCLGPDSSPEWWCKKKSFVRSWRWGRLALHHMPMPSTASATLMFWLIKRSNFHPIRVKSQKIVCSIISYY